MREGDLIEDGKFHEIYTGNYYATERGWRVGLGDQDLDIQLALYLDITDMLEATGEKEFEDWPLNMEISLVVARPGPLWLEKALGSGSGADSGEISEEQALEESYRYGGGIPVTHILLDEISGGESNTTKFSRDEVKWVTKPVTHGTIAAQRGKGYKFRYPMFREDDVALRFAEELLKRADGLFGMVGFHLDRPVNMVGDDGWSMIAEQSK